MNDGSHEKLIKSLADSGRLVEAGWISLRVAVIPADASEIQLSEMRKAFFSGAQHIFSSIMNFLEEGTEPTGKDLNRMDLLHQELQGFVKELKEQILT